MTTLLNRLRRDERGISSVEYIIIVALVAFLGFTAWQTFGTAVSDKASDAADTIENKLDVSGN